MNSDDFYLSILIGITSGLIVLLGQFIGESISNIPLKIAVTIATPFILFMIFVKILERQLKNKRN